MTPLPTIKGLRGTAISSLLALAFSLPAHAAIYSWQDERTNSTTAEEIFLRDVDHNGGRAFHGGSVDWTFSRGNGGGALNGNGAVSFNSFGDPGVAPRGGTTLPSPPPPPTSVTYDFS